MSILLRLPGYLRADHGPSSLGLFLLDRLPAGMTINSIPFHRAATGMRKMFDVFVSTDKAARKAAAEPFDYLGGLPVSDGR